MRLLFEGGFYSRAAFVRDFAVYIYIIVVPSGSALESLHTCDHLHTPHAVTHYGKWMETSVENILIN